jgi:hypothetical protein
VLVPRRRSQSSNDHIHQQGLPGSALIKAGSTGAIMMISTQLKSGRVRTRYIKGCRHDLPPRPHDLMKDWVKHETRLDRSRVRKYSSSLSRQPSSIDHPAQHSTRPSVHPSIENEATGTYTTSLPPKTHTCSIGNSSPSTLRLHTRKPRRTLCSNRRRPTPHIARLCLLTHRRRALQMVRLSVGAMTMGARRNIRTFVVKKDWRPWMLVHVSTSSG